MPSGNSLKVGKMSSDQKLEDAVLKRMLETPPMPFTPKKAALFDVVIRDGKMLIAKIINTDARSITADLYRNLADFDNDSAIERATCLIVR